jgi:hypothetical protein
MIHKKHVLHVLTFKHPKGYGSVAMSAFNLPAMKFRLLGTEPACMQLPAAVMHTLKTGFARSSSGLHIDRSSM